MATYAANLAEVQTLQTCGVGFIAYVADPSIDIITVKTPSASHLCGTNDVYKTFHGGHAEIDLSGDDNIT